MQRHRLARYLLYCSFAGRFHSAGSVLDDAQRCRSIVDPSLRERCRQLNTYRAAFLHVDTFDDAQRGRRLCGEVDAGWLSETCLKHVAACQ